MPTECILAIDQGTTSSRAIVFDASSNIVSIAQQEYPQLYPQDGWVEHRPNDIWKSVLETSRAAFSEAESKGMRVVAIGITNQRETSIVWDKTTREPIHNAIVWQDRRTLDRCAELREDGKAELLRSKTGLVLDPYFSASKIAWILDEVSGAREKAERGELAFGTVDTFLIDRFTNGEKHLTDATNAARTSLFNIHSQVWDDELLDLFNVPKAVLPSVLDSSSDFGETATEYFGRPIPILGVAGDQHAACIGQSCFDQGAIKSTYGTGCFVMINTGAQALVSENKLLTTIAYRLNGRATYALEGSIFTAGSALKWMRDSLGLIATAVDSEALANQADEDHGVYFVPAFVGLGAPHWNSEVRGSIFGINASTGKAELVRAALESVCFQTRDLFEAMQNDGIKPSQLKVDGGMVENKWLCQFLADILDMPVDRPQIMETTALGAAYLAGMQLGLFPSPEAIKKQWKLDRRFLPSMPASLRSSRVQGWSRSVNALLNR